MGIKPENLSRVGAVFLLRDDGAALLQMRDDKPGLRNAAMLVPPGGHADPGEDIETCARREFLEETAYACGELNWLCSFVDEVPGWPPYELTVFWARYDGRQKYVCREGQWLEFVRREDAVAERSPAYLRDLWNQAWREFMRTKVIKANDSNQTQV
jgi:8-oxo-dGTP pyrophosphatase MutT (NUDIX family)